MKSIYVGNLSYGATEEELKTLFAQYGEVESVKLVTDRETGRPRGFGFVQMEDQGALTAIEALNGKEFGGRNLRINEARERSERPSGGGFDRKPRD
ncbi:MAG: RNA-binding protein [Lentisphaerae bacterium GWF2_44_16]|nr:MAG: RNA-binding protein [Lentisphaerae bacterium GWF2_44_16]